MGYSLSEDLIRRKLNLIELNKIPAEALVGFVKQTQEQAILMKSDSKQYSKAAENIKKLMEEKKLVHIIDVSTQTLDQFSKEFTDAVDGSNQFFPKPDGTFIYFFSTAKIRYPDGYGTNVEVTVAPFTETIGKIDPKFASSEAGNFMMRMETETMKHAIETRSEGGILFLDGPIIDPPENIISDEYLQQRTLTIKEAFRKKITVIGIVKRIMGDMFTTNYKSYFSSNQMTDFENMNSDKNLAVHVLTKSLKSDKDSIAYTEPFKISNINYPSGKEGKNFKKTAQSYHDEGVDVVTFIMKNGYASPPIRVDVAISSESNDLSEITQNAIKYAAAWAAPGRHIPIPVILAHEKCNIGRGAAQILFTEFIAGSKSNDNEENIIQLQMMGDVH